MKFGTLLTLVPPVTFCLARKPFSLNSVTCLNIYKINWNNIQHRYLWFLDDVCPTDAGNPELLYYSYICELVTFHLMISTGQNLKLSLSFSLWSNTAKVSCFRPTLFLVLLDKW